ncbi:MAG: hypothetical protein M0Z64_00950 [Nitrospiraceae bacterium]|jgi:hypothetical protein|nr:hypothetical protein [Nitrospiraceae bacterium]
MSKATTVRIESLEVKKSDIERVKKIFAVKDNAEAVRKALDMASGKIELESIFQKHKGVKIKKVYA